MRAAKQAILEVNPTFSPEQVDAAFDKTDQHIPQVEADYLKGEYSSLANCSGTFADFNALLIQFGYVGSLACLGTIATSTHSRHLFACSSSVCARVSIGGIFGVTDKYH